MKTAPNEDVEEEVNGSSAPSQPLRAARPQNVAEAHARALQTLRQLHDADEARATARLLLTEVTGLNHAHLLAPQRPLSAEENARFAAWLARLQAGEPLPHVIGSAPFCGLELRSDARALIPRPETELLVEGALLRLQSVPAPRIADLGTGTGAIALAMAHARPDAAIWATDISHEARALARENTRVLGLEARITFVEGRETDWAAALPRAAFDAVLSNPPYIASREIGALQPQVRDWEPHLALDGGADGLACYRLIAQQCGALLRPGGFLMCELGAEQFDAARAVFTREGWHVAEPVFDFAGIARALCATLLVI